MPIVEYLNAVSLLMQKDKEMNERLSNATANAKSAKNNELYIIALLSELVHFK